MAGCPRLFNFCRELSKSHDISLIALNQSDDRRKSFLNDPDTNGVFREITLLPPSSRSCGWLNRQNHRVRLAPHFATKFLQPKYYDEIRRTVDKTIALNDLIDLVYVSGLSMTQYVQSNPKIPAILDLGDSKTLLLKRTTMMERRLLRKIALRLETWSISRWEKALGKYFTLVVMTSKVDESFLKTLDPSAPTLTISNGVDFEYFSPSNAPGNPAQLVFTGVMSYGPNEDAVLYFCKDIFPLIRKECPGTQFWIVGQDPSWKVQALAADSGVHVTGAVDDVRPYVQSAGVFVSPLRYGAGIKNKILAAMAMQKPVVATSLSVDGIEVQADQDVLVADSPKEFATKVVRLIKDESMAGRMGKNGHRLVLKRYSWKSSAGVLEAALHQVVTEKKAFVDPSMGAVVQSTRLRFGSGVFAKENHSK